MLCNSLVATLSPSDWGGLVDLLSQPGRTPQLPVPVAQQHLGRATAAAMGLNFKAAYKWENRCEFKHWLCFCQFSIHFREIDWSSTSVVDLIVAIGHRFKSQLVWGLLKLLKVIRKIRKRYNTGTTWVLKSSSSAQTMPLSINVNFLPKFCN